MERSSDHGLNFGSQGVLVMEALVWFGLVKLLWMECLFAEGFALEGLV